MEDLSSWTTDWTHVPCIARWSLNLGPSGKSWICNALEQEWFVLLSFFSMLICQRTGTTWMTTSYLLIQQTVKDAVLRAEHVLWSVFSTLTEVLFTWPSLCILAPAFVATVRAWTRLHSSPICGRKMPGHLATHIHTVGSPEYAYPTFFVSMLVEVK